jgi:hypothetical protein
VRSIFAQPSAGEVWAQHGRVVEQLQDRFAAAADLLLMAAEDVLAFAVTEEHPHLALPEPTIPER